MYRGLFVAMILLAIAGLLIFWLFAQKVHMRAAGHATPVSVIQEATLRLAKAGDELRPLRAWLANQSASRRPQQRNGQRREFLDFARATNLFRQELDLNQDS